MSSCRGRNPSPTPFSIPIAVLHHDQMSNQGPVTIALMDSQLPILCHEVCSNCAATLPALLYAVKQGKGTSLKNEMREKVLKRQGAGADLRQEPRVVDEHAIDPVLDCVEIPHLLPIYCLCLTA